MTRPPVELIVALERECLKVDGAIAKREWDACEVSWSAQRLLTHELDISIREQHMEPDDYAQLKRRIDRLSKYRTAQLKRLKAFNDACATRLANMGKFRAFAKNIPQEERRSSLLDVTS